MFPPSVHGDHQSGEDAGNSGQSARDFQRPRLLRLLCGLPQVSRMLRTSLKSFIAEVLLRQVITRQFSI